MNMIKKLLLLVLVLGVLGAAVAGYLYRKPAEKTVSGKADYSVEAASLFSEFEQNEDQANEKYLNKVLSVNGTIASIAPADSQGVAITLEAASEMSGVSCQLADAQQAASLKKGDQVLVKGRCTGMLMDVVLVNCTLEKH